MLVRLRNALVMQHKDKIGGFLFDGCQLFSTRTLESGRKTFQWKSKTRNDEEYALNFQFTTNVEMDQPESVQVLNLILRRATGGLKLEMVGRNFYDAQAKVKYYFVCVSYQFSVDSCSHRYCKREIYHFQ